MICMLCKRAVDFPCTDKAMKATCMYGITVHHSKEEIEEAEKIHHPPHYGGEDNPYEVIKVIEAWDLRFALGNALKYIFRAGKKSQTDKEIQEDLSKAMWYLNRVIQQNGGTGYNIK